MHNCFSTNKQLNLLDISNSTKKPNINGELTQKGNTVLGIVNSEMVSK